jgi:hypothetical protein
MEPEETATIVRLVKSVFPQQPVDPTTYETWHLVIGELDFAAAQAAVIAVAHSQKFCAAADIIAEAERASRRHAHPSERTVAEALAASALRELPAAGAVPPTPGYLAAKRDFDRKMAERAEQARAVDRETERRANAWLRYKLTGKLPPELPQLSDPPPPRWVQLPGDPPELREWLTRQAQAEQALT